VGIRIGELKLDGVTAIERPVNPEHYPEYKLGIGPELRKYLLEEQDKEYQMWYDNLDSRYDMIFDLHDNRHRMFDRVIDREMRRLSIGYIMKNGWGAVRDRKFPWAGIDYRCYNDQIDISNLLFSLEGRWNRTHKYSQIKVNDFTTVAPLFLRPSADIELGIEFMPVRIVRTRPEKIRKIRTSTGVSLISSLIETLRSSL